MKLLCERSAARKQDIKSARNLMSPNTLKCLLGERELQFSCLLIEDPTVESESRKFLKKINGGILIEITRIKLAYQHKLGGAGDEVFHAL